MANYRQIKGTLIQNVSADPPASFEGQVWYNTTTNQLRIRTVGVIGSWATGGTMNTARVNSGGAGTQTSALATGGFPSPSPPPGSVQTELYNGSNWTEVNDLNLGRYRLVATGVDNTSSLAFGGFVTGDSAGGLTESWNGSNWTEVGDLTSPRYDHAGNGTQTSALAYGGDVPGTTEVTESWNGTNWTEVSDLNTARQELAGAGADNTSALAFGGVASALTESWNGSSWTEVNDLNTARGYLAGVGTQTAALAFGGGTPTYTSETETWNGTNWTEVNDLNTLQKDLKGAGTNTVALAFLGRTPSLPTTTATEEWSESPGTGNFNITSV